MYQKCGDEEVVRNKEDKVEAFIEGHDNGEFEKEKHEGWEEEGLVEIASFANVWVKYREQLANGWKWFVVQ